ncbi:Protein FAM210B, mitochondrial [Chionoecetes opilio]|uniref:Protein FAM210B, mitochondrial n=1 Tax=Chionoecetes opilio TaxID=41210 RepID=A0A8J4Y3P3_CHIOP|nr:Protein FAM210B, mitochondrial [Chionoecetes opilio]
MHQVMNSRIPGSANICMPFNVEELQNSEKSRFSPRRNRDVSSKLNQVGGVFGAKFMSTQGSQEAAFNISSHPVDSHFDIYDSRITVSLSSVMQTNVPKPYGITGKAPVHLNMPGGQWAQDEKYISGDLHTFHHSNISAKKNPGTACQTISSLRHTKPVKHANVPRMCRSNTLYGDGAAFVDSVNCVKLSVGPNKVCLLSNKAIVREHFTKRSLGCKFFHKSTIVNTQQSHTSDSKTVDTPELQLTSRQKLQRAVKEYGATVIVFHVTISLASLGICYLLVSSGVDMTGVIRSLGISLGQVGEASTDMAVLKETPPVNIPEQACSSTGAPGQTAVADSDSMHVNTKRAAGAATFVVAYAVHKVFAPARIAVTLTATPFIVRHLRKIGFLKPPKAKDVS